MATMRAIFQRFLFPGLSEIIEQAFEEIPDEYPMIFNVKPTDKAFEEDMSWAGTGLFSLTPEGTEIPEDEFVPGFPKRYQFDDYTKEVGFSHQMIRDGKVPLWNDRVKDMGFSAKETREVLHADFFEGGFTTSLTPDGKPFFAVDHPSFRNGAPQSNILDPVGTISVPTVRQMLTQFRRQFDHTGVRRIQVRPAMLVHPPEEEFDVLEILKSAGRPDTANRADNVLRNIVKEFLWMHLTNPKHWFMSCDKARYKLKSFNRENFHTDEREDEKNRMNFVQAMLAFGFGASDYLGWIGANPV